MSPATQRIFDVGVVLSALLGIASAGAGVWVIVGWPFNQVKGVPVGNKDLVARHLGVADVSIATAPTLEIFLSPTTAPTKNARALAAGNRAWGGRDHWLKVPAVEVNLWWPFACSLVLPAVALVRRSLRPRRKWAAFPVINVRQAPQPADSRLEVLRELPPDGQRTAQRVATIAAGYRRSPPRLI